MIAPMSSIVKRICHDVGGMPRMQTATGDQALGIVLRIIRNELVDLGGEADHFRRDVVDQCGAVNAATIEISEERLGRAGIFDDLIEVGAFAPHQFERLRLEEMDRPDVDVAVSDQELFSVIILSVVADRCRREGFRCS